MCSAAGMRKLILWLRFGGGDTYRKMSRIIPCDRAIYCVNDAARKRICKIHHYTHVVIALNCICQGVEHSVRLLPPFVNANISITQTRLKINGLYKIKLAKAKLCKQCIVFGSYTSQNAG